MWPTREATSDSLRMWCFHCLVSMPGSQDGWYVFGAFKKIAAVGNLGSVSFNMWGFPGCVPSIPESYL